MELDEGLGRNLGFKDSDNRDRLEIDDVDSQPRVRRPMFRNHGFESSEVRVKELSNTAKFLGGMRIE